MGSKSKSIGVYILAVLFAFEAVSALYGSYMLINDPTGESISLPLHFLKGTIFSDYSVPGILLLVLIGLPSVFMVYPVIKMPNWTMFKSLNIYKNYHWAWAFSLYNAIILILWIDFQMIILSEGSVIQGVYSLLGISILILTLTPVVKANYRIHSHSRHHHTTHRSQPPASK